MQMAFNWNKSLLDMQGGQKVHPGPVPLNAAVQYIHVLEKGGSFSGMAPACNIIAEGTLVTLSFGSSQAHLILVYVGDTIKMLNAVEVPCRGYSALSIDKNGDGPAVKNSYRINVTYTIPVGL